MQHPRPDPEKIRKMKLKEFQILTEEDLEDKDKKFVEEESELDEMIKKETVKKDYKDKVAKHKTVKK